jgi:hypothetical protein
VRLTMQSRGTSVQSLSTPMRHAKPLHAHWHLTEQFDSLRVAGGLAAGGADLVVEDGASGPPLSIAYSEPPRDAKQRRKRSREPSVGREVGDETRFALLSPVELLVTAAADDVFQNSVLENQLQELHPITEAHASQVALSVVSTVRGWAAPDGEQLLLHDKRLASREVLTHLMAVDAHAADMLAPVRVIGEAVEFCPAGELGEVDGFAVLECACVRDGLLSGDPVFLDVCINDCVVHVCRVLGWDLAHRGEMLSPLAASVIHAYGIRGICQAHCLELGDSPALEQSLLPEMSKLGRSFDNLSCHGLVEQAMAVGGMVDHPDAVPLAFVGLSAPTSRDPVLPTTLDCTTDQETTERELQDAVDTVLEWPEFRLLRVATEPSDELERRYLEDLLDWLVWCVNDTCGADNAPATVRAALAARA